jgi:protein phosphatase inhibitor 2
LLYRLAAAEGSEPKYRIREQESSEEEDNDLSPEEQGGLFLLLHDVNNFC